MKLTSLLYFILSTFMYSQNSSNELLSLTKVFEIGTYSGDDNYIFGRIDDFIVDKKESFYVYDGSFNTIRKYDKNGKYIGTLGREGKGPGEYLQVRGLGINSKNQLCLWDINNSRIVIYKENGEFLKNISAYSNLNSSKDFYVDENDKYYIKQADNKRKVKKYNNFPAEYGVYSEEGTIIDTLIIPDENVNHRGFTIFFSGGSIDNFMTKTISTLAPDGRLIVGRNDEYKFEIRGDETITVEREFEPVRIRGREREEIEKYAEDIFNMDFDFPASKPAFKEIITDRDGRIWIKIYNEALQRSNEGEILVNKKGLKITWFEDPLFDLFTGKGAFIGRIKLPRGSNFLDSKGSFIYCESENEEGIVYLSKYRVEGLE